MRIWKKVALAAIVITAATGTGAAIAQRASQPGDAPAADPAPTAAADLGNGVTESKYVPVTPCRIVDTRLAGGAIGNNSTRNFLATGTSGFTGQGGKSGGCGVPDGATAIEVAVTSVDAAGGGYLRIYPYPNSEPTATFLNYGAGNPTNTGAVTLCKSGCTFDFKVTAHSNATDVVMDVQGYYVKPLAATIASDGSVVRGSRVVSVSHPSTGVYYVTWDRNVSGCTQVATQYFNGQEINATQAINGGGQDGTTLVVTRNYDNSTNINMQFNLMVTC